jgi:hypothetical protein
MNDKDDRPVLVLHVPSYRALLVSPSEVLERPIQAVHPTKMIAEGWAKGILAGRPVDAYVKVLKTEETEVSRIYAPPPEEKPAELEAAPEANKK